MILFCIEKNLGEVKQIIKVLNEAVRGTLGWRREIIILDIALTVRSEMDMSTNCAETCFFLTL